MVASKKLLPAWAVKSPVISLLMPDRLSDTPEIPSSASFAAEEVSFSDSLCRVSARFTLESWEPSPCSRFCSSLSRADSFFAWSEFSPYRETAFSKLAAVFSCCWRFLSRSSVSFFCWAWNALVFAMAASMLRL